MNKIFRLVLLTLSFVICLATVTFGQQNAGSIEGTVKDQKGAVVPGINVTVQGVSVGFSRTVQTDSDGVYRVREIPPGTYKISTAASNGFSAVQIDNVSVSIEKTTTQDVSVGITSVNTVVDVSGDPLGVNIDTSDSKVQTNITSKLIDELPKGQSFASLLQVSPGTRSEPLSGGFQVDGASGSENTFIVDGQSLENFRTGTLNSANNIPTSLVAEIQVKTGGFEAEHGGASGGVVSVATKQGTDTWRAELGTAFESSKLQPGPRFTPARFVGSSSTAANIAANPDFQYAIRQPKDQYLNSYPSATFGGPIVKQHVWFQGAYAPQNFNTTRTSNFYNSLSNSSFSTGTLILTPRNDSTVGSPTFGQQLAPRKFNVNQTFNYASARVDAAFFNNLRGTVTYLWNPVVTKGNIPYAATTTSNPTNVTYGGVSYPAEQYAALQGGRLNANNFTASAVYTPTSKLLVNFRFGRGYLNEKSGNYALPNDTKYNCVGSQLGYTGVATGCPGGIGFTNIPSNSITTRDISIRREINADASYILTGFGGNHEFKGGYLRGRTINDVLSGYAGTGIVNLYYGQDYAQAGTGVSLPCTIGVNGCIGVGTLTRIGTKGVGKNNYQGVYIQDKWQPTSRLTLNLGVRAEKEDLPSFNAGDLLAGTAIPGITLGWGDKIAPRLGGSYDVFGDGKTKVFASYGWFFDRLKFEMPRGSFGGDFYRVDYFPILAANPAYTYYTPAKILGSFTDPRGGGNPSTTGGISQLQRDLRIPSNLTTAQFTALKLVVTGVDPNLKAFRQDEITVGFEREINKSYVLSSRFTRKNVAHAMEDHAILGLGESENYPVGNPGEGLDLQLDLATGTAKSARPQRLYRGLEIVLNKRLSNHYFFNVNYTLSKLVGNYSGLASSDEASTTTGVGRTSPGVDRFFDYPINGYTATGQPDNGNLATDRRHAVKAYGGYIFDWWGSKADETNFSFFQQVLQGTPQTTFITVVATSIPLSKRGDLGRSPTFWQTDLAMTHTHKFGRDSRFRVAFDFNVLNAFNNNTIIKFNTTKYRTSNSIAGTDIDPTYNADTQTLIPILNKILNGQIGNVLTALDNGTLPSLGRPNPLNPLYGKAQLYQNARVVRFGMRFIF